MKNAIIISIVLSYVFFVRVFMTLPSGHNGRVTLLFGLTALTVSLVLCYKEYVKEKSSQYLLLIAKYFAGYINMLYRCVGKSSKICSQTLKDDKMKNKQNLRAKCPPSRRIDNIDQRVSMGIQQNTMQQLMIEKLHTGDNSKNQIQKAETAENALLEESYKKLSIIFTSIFLKVQVPSGFNRFISR